MLHQLLALGARDAFVLLPIILGFGLLYRHLRHIDVSLDGVVVLSGITCASVWRETGNTELSLCAGTLAGALLSGVCSLLQSLLGVPQLMAGVVFSLLAHTVSVVWIGESLALFGTDLLVGTKIPWWLPISALLLAVLTHHIYRHRIGVLIRKLGDGVRVNTVKSPQMLEMRAYLLSGLMYGLGASLYAHKTGSARAGGSFEFLVIALCSFLSISRALDYLRSVIIARESLSAPQPNLGRLARAVTSCEVSALGGALFYGWLVHLVLAYSPDPTVWKLVLSGCLILALLEPQRIHDFAASILGGKYIQDKYPLTLSAIDVSYSYKDGERITRVLSEAEFNITAGLNVIVGANGTGKSTILGLISGRLETQRGQILLGSTNLSSLAPQARPVYLLPQDARNALGNSLTVYDALYAALDMHGSKGMRCPRSELRRILSKAGFNPDAFHSFAVDPYCDDYWSNTIGSLSGGQITITAVFAGLLSNATVLLLDEPTTGVDDQTYSLTKDLLVQACSDKILLATSHDGRLIRIANKVFRIDKGTLAPGPNA